MRCHDLALPSDVAVLDRHAQHETFELATRCREVLEIILRDRSDVEPVLRFGLHQSLLGKACETLADDAGAAVVAFGELGEPQLGAGQHPARQDVGAQLGIDLLGTGDAASGDRWRAGCWLSSLGVSSAVPPMGCIVKHFREWGAISKFS